MSDDTIGTSQLAAILEWNPGTPRAYALYAPEKLPPFEVIDGRYRWRLKDVIEWLALRKRIETESIQRAEVWKHLGISRGVYRALVEKYGEPKRYKQGHQFRYFAEDVDAWLDETGWGSLRNSPPSPTVTPHDDVDPTG